MSKKGGKGKKKGDDEDVDQEGMKNFMHEQVETMKRRLVLEQERTNLSRSKEDDIRQREIELAKDLDE